MRKVVPLIVAGGVLLASGGTLGAIEASAKNVDLIVDGAPRTVRTYQGTVGELLRANEIEVAGRDVVSPSMGAKLTADQDVTVSFARPVELTLDGKSSEKWTTALTVGDFVNELGVRPESKVSEPLEAEIGRDGIALEVNSAKRITVVSGNDPAQESVTTASTVGEALEEQGIKLSDQDKVKPERDASIEEGMTVEIEYHKEKRTKKDVSIPNETVRKKTDSLPKGTEEVEAEGQDGTAVEEWVEKFVNGKSVSKKRVKRTVVEEPQDRIILVGTGEEKTTTAGDDSDDEESKDTESADSGSSGGTESKDSGSDSGSEADSGAGLSGTGQVETCEASNYWQGQITATGEQFDPDAMTAAHKTLPFNTKVKVTNQANGKSVVVRINDRGPYVGGRCIDLSRGSFSKIASPNAGVAQVKVEVLK